MKIGFTSFTCPTWELASMISVARDLGYHGVELRIDARHAHGVEVTNSPEERAVVAEEFQLRGVELCCLSTSIQLVQADSLELLQSRLKLATDLGCKALRVLCGKPDQEMGHHELQDLVAMRLRKAANLGQRVGVAIWLETHDLMSKAKDAAAVLAGTEHENAGLLYNNLHPYRAGESVEDTFIALGAHARHVHFNDGLADPQKVVVRPLGQGQLPLDRMLSGLIQAGYHSYLCAQWFNDQCGDNPEEALRHYHKQLVKRLAQHDVELDRV